MLKWPKTKTTVTENKYLIHNSSQNRPPNWEDVFKTKPEPEESNMSRWSQKSKNQQKLIDERKQEVVTHIVKNEAHNSVCVELQQ